MVVHAYNIALHGNKVAIMVVVSPTNQHARYFDLTYISKGIHMSYRNPFIAMWLIIFYDATSYGLTV